MAIVADLSGNNPIDRPWRTRNRTQAGDPNGTLTPQYAGEIVLDTTGKVRWKAVGTTNNTWVQMTAVQSI